MKATGIIRRIDDLGRVVIPKEVRRNFGIREGDLLEIYTDREGCVIFKKYVSSTLVDKASTWQKVLLCRIGCRSSIYDTSGFVLASNAREALDARVDIDDIKGECNVFPIKEADSTSWDAPSAYLRVWGYDVENPSHHATVTTILALMAEEI